jgi:hypothetical protein
MAFKRLTPAQRAVYAALRALGGEMVVTPQDARPLRALQRRGLVRYATVDEVRVALLRVTGMARRKRTRDRRRWRTMFHAPIPA